MNLRLTKNRLKQIIKEELDSVMFEEYLEEDDEYYKMNEEEDVYGIEEDVIQEISGDETLYFHKAVSHWTKLLNKMRDDRPMSGDTSSWQRRVARVERQLEDARVGLQKAEERVAKIMPGAGLALGMGPRRSRDDDIYGQFEPALSAIKQGRDEADEADEVAAAMAAGEAAEISDLGGGGASEYEHLGKGRYGKRSWGKYGDPTAQVDRSIDLTKRINRRLKGTSGYKDTSFKGLRRAINRAKVRIGKPAWRRLRRLAYKDPAAASAGLKKAMAGTSDNF